MNQQRQIQEKQNEEMMLKCQYAARSFFNRAELFCYLSFAASIGSSICAFIPDSQDDSIWLILPICISVSILIFKYLMDKNHKAGATVRNYFDDVVLGIKPVELTGNNLCNIMEAVNKEVNRNVEKSRIQMCNDGTSNPPGVKDWYLFSKDYSNRNDAVLECQRQNCWWNNKLCKRRLIFYVVLFIMLIGGLCFFLLANKMSTPRIIISILSFIFGWSDQLINNIAYLNISKEMDTIIDLPDVSKSKAQIAYLQDKIEKRRQMPVVEMNWLHKKNSKHWTRQYAERSQY